MSPHDSLAPPVAEQAEDMEDDDYEFSDEELAQIDRSFEAAERDRAEGKLIPAEEVFARLRSKYPLVR